MIDTDKYEGHTPADQWVTYKMGADKPYHAVRFGQRGLDLELEFGADARLIADAPLLLAEVKRLREELAQTRECLWWCYDNYRFDSHPMVDADWNFIGNLLGADMESEEE